MRLIQFFHYSVSQLVRECDFSAFAAPSGLAHLKGLVSGAFCVLPRLEKGRFDVEAEFFSSWFQRCLANSRVSLQMKNPIMLSVIDKIVNVSTLIHVMR